MLGGDRQQAAIITGWDESTELASLVVFPSGASYIITENGVEEGTADGTFQQLGALSHVGESQQQAAQARLERLRQMSSRKETQDAETVVEATTPEP